MNNYIDTEKSEIYHNEAVINNFSVIVTERCNLKCSYCHFYKTVSRDSIRDMSKELLEQYMHFLKYFTNTVGGEKTIRFSGGDPIVLGDNLFDMADIAYKISGLEPYFLTAGKGINEKWIEKARRSAFTHAFISLENPINPDSGSVNPYETIKKVKELSTPEFILDFGVTVVSNEHFKNIYKICKIVFEETGKLPKIQEINYLPYESPTDEQLNQLYENLVSVISEFHSKASMDFFSYISPEFSAAHNKKES